ncbi:MAG: 30S ribosomal protein S7 [Dehalococcoidia bacterium]|nr:30S ribosomal protein S7 [Dehalococcoidia bacterium]
MPRRANKDLRRIIPADAKYNNVTVAKFINKVMLRGQKATAERIVYDALEVASEHLGKEPSEVMEEAIRSATPLLMVRPRRVGGATYQVPMEVDPRRGQGMAMRWIIASVRGRAGKSMREKLASELTDVVEGRGATIKKREDIHRMAQANKAFAHFRW